MCLHLVISADLFVVTQFDGELRRSVEGMPQWIPIMQIPQMRMVKFIPLTLPIILDLQAFLPGVIRHNIDGEPVSYEIKRLVTESIS